MNPQPSRPPIVVLGASNVSRGLVRLAAISRARTGGAADLFVAAGHGRSYGVNSRVALRRLPSILGCGLWRGLDRERAATGESTAPLAVVTDIGNDLLYGFAVDQVAAWVRESVRRLVDHGAMIAITRLPLASIAGVGPFRYRALRTCYVPGCRLTLDDMKSTAERLDDAVVAIAGDFGATLVEQPGDWYGLDAIHVRRRRLDDFWHRVCGAWGLPEVAAPARPSFRDWARLGTKSAEVRSVARVMRFTPQPVVQRPDLRLWLY
ncbi:MAG: hypothetical protein K8S94_01650 [Planctomycetia bacterium]|nr:hypothetical protein [Planctomycetia bacterium]